MPTTIRTSDLTGLALAYAVAKAEGLTERLKNPPLHGARDVPLVYTTRGRSCSLSEADCLFSTRHLAPYHPHTDWTIAGPIIERENIFPDFRTDGLDDGYSASAPKAQQTRYGHTQLIAAMRCYVAMKLGDSVAVPEYL